MPIVCGFTLNLEARYLVHTPPPPGFLPLKPQPGFSAKGRERDTPRC